MTKAALLLATFAVASPFVFAGPVSYTVNFNITTNAAGDSIGPATFSFDSLGQSNTTIGPPVTLSNYAVWINGTSYGQTSPGDDSVTLGGTGLITGLNVDSGPTPGNLFLDLFSNGTFFLEPHVINTSLGAQVATFTNGTYTITTSSVPEPASFGLVALLLASGFVLRSRLHKRPNDR